MKTINLYEEDNVLSDNAREKFNDFIDALKDKIDSLKGKASEFVDFASNYADNDLSKEQLAFRQYGDAILEMLDELDDKADEIEKENSVSNIF